MSSILKFKQQQQQLMTLGRAVRFQEECNIPAVTYRKRRILPGDLIIAQLARANVD